MEVKPYSQYVPQHPQHGYPHMYPNTNPYIGIQTQVGGQIFGHGVGVQAGGHIGGHGLGGHAEGHIGGYSAGLQAGGYYGGQGVGLFTGGHLGPYGVGVHAGSHYGNQGLGIHAGGHIGGYNTAEQDTGEKEKVAGAAPITQEYVEKMLAGWTGKPLNTARAFIAKYGLPHEASKDQLAWRNSDPWIKLVVCREYTAV